MYKKTFQLYFIVYNAIAGTFQGLPATDTTAATTTLYRPTLSVLFVQLKGV